MLNASLAQLVEQLIRNEQVVGSSPMRGSGQKPVKSRGSRGSRTPSFFIQYRFLRLNVYKCL
jgi:hypothetical protein